MQAMQDIEFTICGECRRLSSPSVESAAACSPTRMRMSGEVLATLILGRAPGRVQHPDASLTLTFAAEIPDTHVGSSHVHPETSLPYSFSPILQFLTLARLVRAVYPPHTPTPGSRLQATLCAVSEQPAPQGGLWQRPVRRRGPRRLAEHLRCRVGIPDRPATR